MTLFTSIKAIWPLVVPLLPILLPRAFSYYRAFRTSLATAPPPRPLPPSTTRSLNILFFSTCLFFLLTLPFTPRAPHPNIFALTNSRLHIPNDVLFTRLSLLRPNQTLTSLDLSLKEKLQSRASRLLYLRFGAPTLVDCPFCHPDDPNSYPLYHLPTNVLLPHLTHLLLLGLATSAPLCGTEASLWRTPANIASLAIALLDIYLTATYTGGPVDGNMPAPSGPYFIAATLRPLALCCTSAIAALLIYCSATNRLAFIIPSAESHASLLLEKQKSQLDEIALRLRTTTEKLHTLNIVKSAEVRDPRLKGQADQYWRAVVAMEGPGGGGGSGGGIWADEEVQAAMTAVVRDGAVDVENLRREGRVFVEAVTRGLEHGTG